MKCFISHVGVLRGGEQVWDFGQRVEKKQLRGERQKETSCTSFRNLNFRDKDALRDGGTKSDSGLHLISNPNKSQLELAQTQLNSTQEYFENNRRCVQSAVQGATNNSFQTETLESTKTVQLKIKSQAESKAKSQKKNDELER